MNVTFSKDEIEYIVSGQRTRRVKLERYGWCEKGQFWKIYHSFDEAVRKYLQLKDEGWEDVKLTISNRESKEGVSWAFGAHYGIAIVTVDR